MFGKILLALGSAALVAASGSVSSMATGPRVMRVGSFHGIAGQFQTIQAAVSAAQPGDWILIGPGDYHEQGSANDGVLVTTPDIHLRGMEQRNRGRHSTRCIFVQLEPCCSTIWSQWNWAQRHRGIKDKWRVGLDLTQDLAALNAAPGITADAQAQAYLSTYITLDRNLSVPVLAMHTTGDGLVVDQHEQALLAAAITAPISGRSCSAANAAMVNAYG